MGIGAFTLGLVMRGAGEKPEDLRNMATDRVTWRSEISHRSAGSGTRSQKRDIVLRHLRRNNSPSCAESRESLIHTAFQ